MADNNDLQKLFQQLNSKNIVYNKAYYKLTKSVSGAVLLSHLTYLFNDVFDGREFYQTDKQLRSSLGFSERTLKTAKTKVRNFVSTVKRGVPAKNHWTVHTDVIIQSLISINNVETSGGETVIPSEDETVPTGKDETVRTKKQVLKKQELKNNNNKEQVVALDIVEEARRAGVEMNESAVEVMTRKHSPEYILRKLKILQESNGISNPVAWLRVALEKDYQSPTKKSGSVSRTAECWSPELQRRRNAAVQSNPNTEKDIMLREYATKLGVTLDN